MFWMILAEFFMSFIHFKDFFYMEWRLTYNFDKNVAFIRIVFRGGGGGCLEVLRLCVFENALIIAR